MKLKYWICAAIASGVLNAGCSRTEVSERSNSHPVADKIRLISWSEYFDPAALEAFTHETGIEVEYVTFDDPDELEARLASEPGAFDVVVTDDLSINRLAELHLLQPLDKAALPISAMLIRNTLVRTLIPATVCLFLISGERR